MTLRETAVAGAFVLESERIDDDRGFFARIFSSTEFADHGLEPFIAECSVAYNHARGTMRGLHYQATPHEETKVVRCTRGSVYDVAVDLRQDSATHLHWAAVELTGTSESAFYIPTGCAHGYLTLEDDTELLYQISVAYVPDAASGVRWDDPSFGIEWPSAPRVISPRDASYPDYALLDSSGGDDL